MKNENRLTPIEYLKSYYCIKDGEEFDVIDDETNGDSLFNPHQFVGNSIFNCIGEIDDDILIGILTGEYTVRKRTFMPKEGEHYFFISNKGYIYETINLQWLSDIVIIKLGWAFRTEEEAEGNRERILKEMHEVMKR